MGNYLFILFSRMTTCFFILNLTTDFAMCYVKLHVHVYGCGLVSDYKAKNSYSLGKKYIFFAGICFKMEKSPAIILVTRFAFLLRGSKFEFF